MSEPLAARGATAARSMIARGAAALMAAQSPDGGWHSTTYGSLRSGAAVTALAVYAVAHTPQDVHEKYLGRLEEGCRFLLAGLLSTGLVASPDGTVDYPTYASACLLVAARRIDLGLEAATIQLLTNHLLDAQLDERRQFDPASPHHGGWDLMGGQLVQGLTSGTTISLTCFALEGLSTVKTPAANEARAKALRWLRGVQNFPGDGGFFFSPDRASDGNKAQWTDAQMQHPRSYGSTTADGLRSLVYAGAPPDLDRVTAAEAWLAKHERLDATPGFEDVPPETEWAASLRYYYYYSLAKALPYFRDPAPWRARMLSRLAAEQRPGGAWINRASRMREDDPLIATSLALIAASQCL